jgi:hypothetical protein
MSSRGTWASIFGLPGAGGIIRITCLLSKPESYKSEDWSAKLTMPTGRFLVGSGVEPPATAEGRRGPSNPHN